MRFLSWAAQVASQDLGREEQPSDPRGDSKFVYSVKNTFLHVEDSDEDQAGLRGLSTRALGGSSAEEDLSGASQPWLSEASLGPPLQFLPKARPLLYS